MNLSESKHFKIAIYVRVSTEEQAENPEGSIRNQEERLRQTVRYQQDMGKSCEVGGVFIDAGLSAKDMNRPALQRLLKAVREGQVNQVMVTELSRLSRSTKDFEQMWDFFKSMGCEFHSLREHFDTSTAAGELMLKSFANFAEFERKQTAERISASFKIRAERGLYNGGSVPFGYKLSSTRGKLDVNPDQAKVVNIAFKAFLREGTLTAACLWLNGNGHLFRRKMEGTKWVQAGHFRVDALHKLLTNKSYIGLKVYSTKTGKKEAKASWEPIVDEITFNRVQEKLSKNHCAKKPETVNRFPFILTEVIYCGVCGEKLAGKSAHGKTKKHPYYEHGRRTRIQSALAHKIYNCDPHRVPAIKAEEAVWSDIEKLLEGDFADELLSMVVKKKNQNQYSQEIERLKNRVYSVNAQTEALTLRLAELPREVSASPIYKQMEKLGIEKTQFEERILKLKDEESEKEVPTDALTYDKLLAVLKDLKASGLTTAKKQKIVTCLIERIEIFPDKIEIHYGVGRSKIKKELVLSSSYFNHHSAVECSTSLTIGGPTQSIGEHRIAHDFIELSPRTPARIIEKCAPLYEKGLSLRDIQERTGIAKSTIRETLTKNGFALRNPLNGNASRIDNKRTKRGGSTPFGYAYLDGKLLMDPKEQIALRKLLSLWKSGKSYQAIADELNDKKIPTRSGKPWIKSVVRSIVLKAKEK